MITSQNLPWLIGFAVIAILLGNYASTSGWTQKEPCAAYSAVGDSFRAFGACQSWGRR